MSLPAPTPRLHGGGPRPARPDLRLVRTLPPRSVDSEGTVEPSIIKSDDQTALDEDKHIIGDQIIGRSAGDVARQAAFGVACFLATAAVFLGVWVVMRELLTAVMDWLHAYGTTLAVLAVVVLAAFGRKIVRHCPGCRG